MEKVLTRGESAARLPRPATGGRVLEFPGTVERTGRTFVCSVLFLEIVEYAKKPIGQQLQAKERVNARVSRAVALVPVADRIILDSGDGVAIAFLGDPEDALRVAFALAPALAADAATPARIGINLGPVQLARDIHGQPNLIGDGLNVAQRIMSFARPGQMLVSRGYHEAVVRIATEYTALFAYQGPRTDSHVREHEVFELSAPIERVAELVRRRTRARRSQLATQSAASTATPHLLRSRRLAWVVTAGSSLLLIAATVSVFRTQPAAKPAPHTAARAVGQVRPVASGARPAGLDAAPARPIVAAQAAAQPPAQSHAAPLAQSSAAGAQAKPVPPEARKPEPPAPATKADAAAPALVVLAISPWGEVFVDGRSMGVSPPLARLELAPGKHRIVVRNGGLQPFQGVVELASKQTVRIKHKFVPTK